MLKDIAALVQICFYIVGATIAILTYRSAKRGLLNTVNTEYHKKVIEHLEKLSETLYSELETRDKHFSDIYLDSLRRDVEIILEQYHLSGELSCQFGLSEAEASFMDLQNKIRSDPFIPDHIVEHIDKYLNDRTRVMVMNRVEISHDLKEYHKLDKLNKISADDVRYNAWRKMEKTDYSQEGVQLEIYKIRMMIKDYLKSFNPLP